MRIKIHTWLDWTYAYDRTSRVWRGLNQEGLEINAYQKEEFFWRITHYSDKHPIQESALRVLPPSTEFTDQFKPRN